ncbi:MAG: TIM barrel protein, partial [Planctomycetota bacterium]
MTFQFSRRRVMSLGAAIGGGAVLPGLGSATQPRIPDDTEQDDTAQDETAEDDAVKSPDQNRKSDADQDAKSLPFLDRIGLQLYTVRDQMADNAAATLKAIAKAGYQQVELMSIDSEALQIARMARDEGLMVHSAFLDWRCITTPDNQESFTVDQTIEMAERIGLRHVVFGYIGREDRDTVDKCKRISDRANEAAGKARTVGLRMAYHNHAFEFGKLAGSGQTAFDIFLDRFDPQLMDFELDVFW